jgi:hypothetical protein
VRDVVENESAEIKLIKKSANVWIKITKVKR